ncbi:MAG TPA: HAD family phosphatase [Candidatus Bathyarchaeia archaeon]|nr:HAD family phosphatase [Candidatus Bathyarchaeia archaeon]
MTPSRGPVAAIFDMDGVLIDSGAHHRAAWRALLEEIGEDADPEHWRLTIGRPSEEAVPLLLGRPLSDWEIQRLARRKRDLYVGFSRAGIMTVAGVDRFVAGLAGRDIPRAVGTSASNFDVHHLLADAGLRRYFDVIVTADDVTYGKPDPEVYLLAAARLRVRPEMCVVFEDSLVGLEAARRAGMRAIGVTTAHTADELLGAGAERAIANFEDLEWPAIARP